MLEKNELEVSMLCTFEVDVMMQKAHPLAKKRKLVLKDFIEYGFIFCNDSAPMKSRIKKDVALKNTKTLILDNRVLMEKYLKSSNMVTFMPNGSVVSDEFVLRQIVEAPVLEQQAIYRKGELDSELLRCINMMKLIIDSTPK